MQQRSQRLRAVQGCVKTPKLAERGEQEGYAVMTYEENGYFISVTVV